MLALPLAAVAQSLPDLAKYPGAEAGLVLLVDPASTDAAVALAGKALADVTFDSVDDKERIIPDGIAVLDDMVVLVTSHGRILAFQAGGG